MRFFAVTNLVMMLRSLRPTADMQLEFLGGLRKVRVEILDEFGYASVAIEMSRPLLQVMNECHKGCCLVVTAKIEFG